MSKNTTFNTVFKRAQTQENFMHIFSKTHRNLWVLLHSYISSITKSAVLYLTDTNSCFVALVVFKSFKQEPRVLVQSHIAVIYLLQSSLLLATIH